MALARRPGASSDRDARRAHLRGSSVVASIPAALSGALGEESFERASAAAQIAIFLAVFGVLLWGCRQPPERGLEDIRIGQAVAIGISQILALMPGASRSGITITTGRFLATRGATRPRASPSSPDPDRARRGGLQRRGAPRPESPRQGLGRPFVVGTIAAAAVGLVAIASCSATSAATTTRRSCSTASPSPASWSF